jgi:hypothetical protein
MKKCLICDLRINKIRASETFHNVSEQIKLECTQQSIRANFYDGDDKVTYELINNKYYYINHDKKTIYAIVNNKGLKLISFSNINILQSFVNKCNPKMERPKKNRKIPIYRNNGSNWSDAIYVRANNKNPTSCMDFFIKDYEEFLDNSELYENKNALYRRGYIIEGKMGTGKTTFVRYLANKYNKSIYDICMSSKELNDSEFGDLIVSVKTHSIILLDEFEKYYSKCKLTEGGILTAFDGVIPISHGTILILIVNDINKIPESLLENLLRPGRIDKKFTFVQKV